MSITVSSIYRYPIKGLSAELLARVTLSTGEAIRPGFAFFPAEDDA